MAVTCRNRRNDTPARLPQKPVSISFQNVSPERLLDPAVLQRAAAELSARDAWSRAALLDVQQRRLAAMLEHAVSQSRYYRDTIGRAVAAGASLDDLPILTKRALTNEWDRTVTDSRLRLRDVEAHLAGDRCGALLLGEFRPFATGVVPGTTYHS